MNDPILKSWLETQYREGMALAERSDLLDLIPVDQPPYRRYVLRFSCRGLVHRQGQVEEADRFEVGIRFPDDYLKRAHTAEVVTLLGPPHTWHPNVLHFWVCMGDILAGTSLVDLIYTMFEILTYHKVTMDETNALNPSACAWARENQHRFPIDRRPLVRRGGES